VPFEEFKLFSAQALCQRFATLFFPEKTSVFPAKKLGQFSAQGGPLGACHN
jgi:hypothetical protein